MLKLTAKLGDRLRGRAGAAALGMTMMIVSGLVWSVWCCAVLEKRKYLATHADILKRVRLLIQRLQN